MPERPAGEREVEDHGDDDAEVDGEVVLEGGVGEDELEVDRVWDHEEASGEPRQVVGGAEGGLVGGSARANLQGKGSGFSVKYVFFKKKHSCSK